MGEMERKDATIHDTVLYPSRERGRFYRHQKLLPSRSPWVAPTSGHPDPQLLRSRCHAGRCPGSPGQLGKRRVVCQEGRPGHLLLALTCVARCLPAAPLGSVCYAHRFFPFGPRKLPFLFMCYFTCASASSSQTRCTVCYEGQAEQSKLQPEAAVSVYKHSGQTLQTSGFCSKFLSAHVKQLSKREALASERSRYDPEYPARQGPGTNTVFKMEKRGQLLTETTEWEKIYL